MIRDVLGHLPWWVWLLVALLVYGIVMESRVRAADARVRAIEERVEKAKLEELGKARAGVAKELTDLRAGRAALEASVRASQAQAAQIAAALGRIDGELSKVRAEGRQLVESGTVDEVVGLGARLGYHPVPMARPR